MKLDQLLPNTIEALEKLSDPELEERLRPFFPYTRPPTKEEVREEIKVAKALAAPPKKKKTSKGQAFMDRLKQLDMLVANAKPKTDGSS